MIIEAGAASVIAVTAHSPFGETERSAGRWLPYLRLLAAIALAGLAILALQLGAVGENLNDGIAVLARNVIGFTVWVPEIVSLAPDLGFLHPDWSVANGSRANLDSGTISSRDLPPALPDLRAAMRLAGPAAPL
jgi:hypothetical protein